MPGCLNKEFEYVRKTFFPQWDRSKEWRIRVSPNLLWEGKFNDRKKIILIRHIPESRDDLLRLLIHEICHLASPSHGKLFLNRLWRAKNRAGRLGLEDLALKISDEVSKYEMGKSFGVGWVYDKISEWVSMEPDISWTRLLKSISRSTGFCTREFLKKFKRAKPVFLAAKHEVSKEKELRAKFEQLKKGGEHVQSSAGHRPMKGGQGW